MFKKIEEIKKIEGEITFYIIYLIICFDTIKRGRPIFIYKSFSSF